MNNIVKLFFVSIFCCISFFSAYGEIANEISKRKDFIFLSEKKLYQIDDTINFSFFTPEVYLKTGGYGWAREDKVRLCTYQTTLKMYCNGKTITLRQYDLHKIEDDVRDYTIQQENIDFKASTSFRYLFNLADLEAPLDFVIFMEQSVHTVYKEGYSRDTTFVAQKKLTLFNCNGGTIAPDVSIMPNLMPDGATPLYGFYNENNGFTYSFINVTAPTTVDRNITEWVNWIICDSEKEITSEKVNITKGSTYLDHYYKYGDFLIDKNSEIDGDKLYVKRIYKNNEFQCSSNPVQLLVLNTLSLPGFKENNHEIYLCPSSDESTTFTLYGNTIDWEGKESQERYYNLEYGWEYMTPSINSWRKVTQNLNTDSLQINLKLPISFIMQNESVEFRQYVQLNNFGKKKIYSKGNYPDITVQLYDTLRTDNFSIKEFPIICGGQLTSDTISIVFNPDKDANYKSVNVSTLTNGGNQFDFLVESDIPSVSNKYTGNSLSIPFSVLTNERINNYIYVTDGCNNSIKLDASLPVNSKPILDKSHLLIDGGSVNYNDGNQSVLRINAPDGKNIKLSISDEDNEKNICRYLITYLSKTKDTDDNYTWEEPSTINAYFGHTISSLISKEEWYGQVEEYIKIVKENQKTKCVSDPIYVTINYLGDIYNNKIEFANRPSKNELYLCNGSGNPAINGEYVSGGYGDDTYSYVWQYSSDSIVWNNMQNANSQIIISQNLKASDWIKTINQTYYIRRMATSIDQGASESSAIKQYSNVLKVAPFTKPIPELTINNKQSELFVCYKSLVSPSGSFSNQSQLEAEEQDLKTFFMYENYKGEKKMLQKTGDKISIKRDTILYAATEFCTDTIYSKKFIVHSGRNLEISDKDISWDKCLVRGDTAKVNIKDYAEYTQGFIVDEDTIHSNKTEMVIPYTGDLQFKVFRTYDGCTQITIKSINGDLYRDALTHHKLTVSSDGIQEKNGQYNVCYGNVIQVYSPNEAEDPYISYSWYCNDTPLDKVYSSNSLTYSNLEYADYNYTIIRNSYLMAEDIRCQSIQDTLLLKTYPTIQGVSVDASKTSLCYDDSLTATINKTKATGGYGKYTYNWFYQTQDTLLDLGQSTSNEFSTPLLSQSGGLYAVVTDKYCTDPSYQYKTLSQKVTVEKNLDFQLTATPSTINKQDLENDKTVAINLLSEDIEATERINCWLDSTKIKSNEVFLGRISHSLKMTDFVNNMANFTVQRIGANATCTQTKKIDILLNEGFDGVPVIASTQTINNHSVLCDSMSVTLSIDNDQLPKYDNQAIAASEFTYQWYKRNSGSWSTCGSNSSLTVLADAKQIQEYRCKLSYTPKGGTKQSVMSDVHFVEGIGTIDVGYISFINEDEQSTKVHYVCRGETGTVLLSANSSLSATSYQWYQRTNTSDWQPVPTDKNTIGTDAPLCTIDLENYTTNTSFKLAVTNECGVISESKNQIQLIFNAASSFSPSEIIMTSNNIYEGKKLDSISLSVPKDHGSQFYWSTDPTLSASSWKVGNPVILDNNGRGFEKGNDSVFVYMVSNGKGNCLSDTITYHFNVFEKLTAGKVVNTGNDSCCANTIAIPLSISYIKGGDEKYDIQWMYKSGKMTDFAPVIKDANMPFTFTYSDLNKTSAGIFSNLIISYIQETCEFYANISCKGDYPGKSYNTGSCVVYVYPPLKSGSIDNSTELLCYNDVMASIKGTDAEGGDRYYSYQWLKSTDKKSWEDITEQSKVSFIGLASQDRYKLGETTYFCRVVTDGCNYVDTSEIKTVQVKSQVLIQPDDILYTPLIPRGDKAKLWGVVNGSEYVWFDKNQLILDTTDVRGIFTTDNINESKRTYYAKTLYDGCASTNYDTIQISTYDIDGGHLSFDNFVPTPTSQNYWICSGADAGRISADGGGNLNYRWFYTINDNGNSRAYALYSAQNTAVPVTSSSVLLDTCNLKTVLTNATGTQSEKKISFFRVSYFTINGAEQTETSDTVSLYIVPTLSLSASLLLDGTESLAGTITSDKELYCVGESGGLIDGTVNPTSSLYNLWSNGQFGPYLYDNEAPEFETWFEYGKNGLWEKGEVHSGIADYAQFYNITQIDTSYTVRRALSDGCSTSYSNTIKQLLSDKAPKASKIVIKGMTPEGKSISDGIEMGDAISVNYTELGYECFWFADENCTDTLVKNNQLITFDTITNETPTVLYLKRKDNTEDGCFSSALAIPLTFNTKSKGGYIYKDQYACHNKMFNSIISGKLAEGYTLSPISGKLRAFNYQWQISTDANQTNWTNIDGATEADSLSAEKIYSLISDKVTTYYIRRMATTETGRSCYSDTVKLHLYEPLQPGTISLINCEKPNPTFCHSDSLPSIATTIPQGGYYGYVGIDGYAYEWQISINNAPYTTLSKLSTTTNHQLDLDFAIRYCGSVDLDDSQDNNIQIRALYKDECEEVFSEPISLKIWAATEQPSIYQGQDSCGSDAVTIKANNTTDYNYTWVILDDNEQITWSYTQDSLKLQRISQLEVTQYGVIGTHNTSGCKSDITFFNIDSLPILYQEPLTEPLQSYCYNTTIEIAGGKAIGGTGERSFQWEYSYDGITFDELSTEENLTVPSAKHSLYVHRIVNDKCLSDTSNTILLKVNPKLEAHSSDLTFYDHQCEGQMIKVEAKQNVIDSILAIWPTKPMNMFWTITKYGYSEEELDAIQNERPTYPAVPKRLDGFEGSYENLRLRLSIIDSFDNRCSSETEWVTLYNATALEPEQNKIESSTLSPCQGNNVEIKGSVITTMSKNDPITYEWFQSTDMKEWVSVGKESLKPESLTISVQDSVYVKRVVSNNCKSVDSNILHLVATPYSDWDYINELGISVITNTNNVELVFHNRSIEKDYVLEGDGRVPSVWYGTIHLPYAASTYQDSALFIRNTSGCYNPYRIIPLSGGNIYSEKEVIVCEGSEAPTLRVTSMEGGTEDFVYQWQYKNEFIKEYIDIADAQSVDYTPQPIDNKTWYRRITKSGVYTSYSNEVSLSTLGQLKVDQLRTNEPDSLFTSKGLKFTDSEVEFSSNLPLSLVDTIHNASYCRWQKSEDGVIWEEISNLLWSIKDSVTTLPISSYWPSAFYRLHVANACDTMFSNTIYVHRLETPAILDEEVQIRYPYCAGNSMSIYVDSPDKNHSYMYTYQPSIKVEMKTESYVQYVSGDTISCDLFIYNITEPFDILITRISSQTNEIATKAVHIPLNDVKPSFYFTIDSEKHSMNEYVVIEPGTLVSFHNQTEGELENIYWYLSEPVKKVTGFDDNYGVRTDYENPDCYFYNEGRHIISLYVTDNYGCKFSVSDSSIVIKNGTVRNNTLNYSHFVTEFDELNPSTEPISLSVYPTHFDESITVSWKDTPFTCVLYDELGRIIFRQDATDNAIILTHDIPNGNYILQVNDAHFKLIK